MMVFPMEVQEFWQTYNNQGKININKQTISINKSFDIKLKELFKLSANKPCIKIIRSVSFPRYTSTKNHYNILENNHLSGSINEFLSLDYEEESDKDN